MNNLLIYELHSGVGYCNQIFSLETAIYLSNVLKKKLILIIQYPLAHIGIPSWDNGYLLDFFNGNFYNYLPYGCKIYYKNIPQDINNIKKNENTINFTNNKFSHQIWVDKELYISINMKNIKNFAYDRIINVIDWNKDFIDKNIYVNKSNASRCFYNFYTNLNNYKLMNAISLSLTKYNYYITKINNFVSNYYNFKKINCVHFRFGDKKNDTVHNNLNDKYEYIINNIGKNEIIIIMSDRKNEKILKNLEKYYNNLIYIEEYLNNSFIQNNLKNFKQNYSIIEFIIFINIASKCNLFFGTHKSTVSNYINYLRHQNNLFVSGYLNYENISIYNNKTYPWIECNHNKGHPISWNAYFGLNFKF